MAEIRLDHHGVMPHGRGWPLGDGPSAVHHQHAVGQFHQHAELVLDQQDGLAARLEGGDDLLDFGGFGLVHPRRRFIEKEELGAQRESPCDLDAPPVGVGQAVRGMVEARQQAVPEQSQDVLDLLAQGGFLGPYSSGTHEGQEQFGESAKARYGRAGSAEAYVAAD